MKTPAPFPAATWVAAGLTAVIFILDLFTPLGVAVWLLYVLPVFCAAYSPRARLPLWIAGVCTGLIVVGFFASPPGIAPGAALLNRLLNTGLLWAVAILLVRRKQAEQERRKFALLAESSSEFIGMCDLDLRPLYVNPAGMRMVGLPDLAAACRVKVQDYFFPEDQRFITEEFFPRVIREGHGDVEIRLRHFQTGEPIWMFYYLFSVRDASGTAVGWATVSRNITERKKAEAALREERDFTASLLNSLPGVVYCYDERFRFVRWNKNFETVTGYTAEEVGRQSPLDYFAGADQAVVAERIREVFTRGAASVEAHFVSRDGTRTPFYFTGVRAEIGGKPHLVGVGLDISAHQRAEAALHESHARLKKVLEVETVGVMFWDLTTGCMTDANDTFLNTMGYSRADLEARALTWQRLTPPEYVEASQAEIRKFQTSGRVGPYEKEYLRKDGTRNWFVFAGSSLGGNACVEFCVDISDRKRAEAAAGESAERLRLALDAAHMGTFDWDVRGNRIVWSHWHEVLWGFHPGEFDGTYESFASRVHPDDLPNVNAEVARCIAAREPWWREFRVVWPDGSVHWILGQGEFTFDAAGQASWMRGVVKEVTERKQAEAQRRELTLQLQEAQDDERRRIARDLHDSTAQKLAAATMNLGALEAALAPAAAGPQQLLDDALRLVEEAAQEIRTLSHVLHPPLLEDLGLAAALRSYVEGFAQRSGIAVSFAVPENLPALPHEVAVTLFRVAQEALANVHRHSGSRTAAVRIASGRDRVTLEVRDAGRGAPLEKFKGHAGVGLASMRGRLELLGGELRIDSDASGTRLHAEVPSRLNRYEEGAHTAG